MLLGLAFHDLYREFQSAFDYFRQLFSPPFFSFDDIKGGISLQVLYIIDLCLFLCDLINDP